MTNTDVRREALRLVNGARKALGVDLLDDLPQGIREDCGLCPVAHALEDAAAACASSRIPCPLTSASGCARRG